jgi:hypothetical protein
MDANIRGQASQQQANTIAESFILRDMGRLAAQVVRNACGLGILDDYHEFAKYNIKTLCNDDEGEKEEEKANEQGKEGTQTESATAPAQSVSDKKSADSQGEASEKAADAEAAADAAADAVATDPKATAAAT